MSFLSDVPWYGWLIFSMTILYIGLIIWFCQKKDSETYDDRKNTKLCLIIALLTIVLIVGSVSIFVLLM